MAAHAITPPTHNPAATSPPSTWGSRNEIAVINPEVRLFLLTGCRIRHRDSFRTNNLFYFASDPSKKFPQRSW
jgi:hypothetical protein